MITAIPQIKTKGGEGGGWGTPMGAGAAPDREKAKVVGAIASAQSVGKFAKENCVAGLLQHWGCTRGAHL